MKGPGRNTLGAEFHRFSHLNVFVFFTAVYYLVKDSRHARVFLMLIAAETTFRQQETTDMSFAEITLWSDILKWVNP